MTTLDPRALEAATEAVGRHIHYSRLSHNCHRCRRTAEAAITAYLAALPHLTAEDLRNTPAGRALVAEGKSLGWDDAIGELRKGQGLHRALAGTLSTRKPSYEETTDDHA